MRRLKPKIDMSSRIHRVHGNTACFFTWRFILTLRLLKCANHTARADNRIGLHRQLCDVAARVIMYLMTFLRHRLSVRLKSWSH